MPFRCAIFAFVMFHPPACVSIKLHGGTNDPSGQCLKFMHIGKTGGTTIDKINFMHPKNDRPYRSYMEKVFDGLAQRESAHVLPWKKARTAEEIFDDSHAGPESGSEFIKTHHSAYTWWRNPAGGECHTHAPPLEGSGAREFYSDGCTNFCVVRDPLTRLLSLYRFEAEGKFEAEGTFGEPDEDLSCSPESFDDFVKSMASNFGRSQYDNWCIAVPQVQMVYGTTSKDATMHPPICHRTLRFEQLEEDFDALMKEFNRSVKLSDVPPAYSASHCKLKPGDIFETTKDKIFELYRGDFEAFNYTRPQGGPVRPVPEDKVSDADPEVDDADKEDDEDEEY